MAACITVKIPFFALYIFTMFAVDGKFHSLL